jgi:arylsulfatase A-like enzyme
VRTRNSSAAIAAAAALVALGGFAWARYAGRSVSIAHRADQNLLLITIDTLRADALGSYGGQALTPNLDQLAAEGLRFDFAHAHAVLTRPSHISILTGLYPYEHGVRDHSGSRLKAGTATVATILKQHGFATGAFVGGVPVAKRFGLGEGFDVCDDRFGRTGNSSDFPLAERPAGEVIAPALEWIRAQQGRWFAWVHLFDPHAPYEPPPPFDREYVRKPYLGEVAYVDQALRPLLDTVRGSSRPTLVLVTSDHGEGLGDHGELTHGLFAYESTLHVPLIIAQLPDPQSRGAVSHVPARHIDVLPTLLDAVDVQVPNGLQGRSLLPDRPQPAARDVASYFEALSTTRDRGGPPLRGIMVGREKYIDLPQPELYDLAADAQEQSNLAERRADRRRALEARLREFHAAPPGDLTKKPCEVPGC